MLHNVGGLRGGRETGLERLCRSHAHRSRWSPRARGRRCGAAPSAHVELALAIPSRLSLALHLWSRTRRTRPACRESTFDTNLAENSEYQAAKADQEFNEARIAELEDKLARAEVIDVSKLSGNTIRFGALVTLIDEDSGEKKVWQVVGEPEADANKGKISVTSPIARALIGKNKGDTVEVEAPGGAKTYKVRKVEWLENGAGK